MDEQIDIFEKTIREQLLGPGSDVLINKDPSAEVISDTPLRRYFTGILFPIKITETQGELDNDQFESSDENNEIDDFKLKGQQFNLNIYQNVESEDKDYLFLPFSDETNGIESYGGGRYIDLRIPEGNQLTIDFNSAYNPYCAYNDKYSCPLTPRKNHLDVEVKAGIKVFEKDSY